MHTAQCSAAPAAVKPSEAKRGPRRERSGGTNRGLQPQGASAVIGCSLLHYCCCGLRCCSCEWRPLSAAGQAADAASSSRQTPPHTGNAYTASCMYARVDVAVAMAWRCASHLPSLHSANGELRRLARAPHTTCHMQAHTSTSMQTPLPACTRGAVRRELLRAVCGCAALLPLALGVRGSSAGAAAAVRSAPWQ